jgi:hypothetical protein
MNPNAKDVSRAAESGMLFPTHSVPPLTGEGSNGAALCLPLRTPPLSAPLCLPLVSLTVQSAPTRLQGADIAVRTLIYEEATIDDPDVRRLSQ